MIGTVNEINNTVVTALKKQNINVNDLVNQFVVIDSLGKLLVGEVENINNETMTINLIGEFVNNSFVLGVINRPNLNASIYLLAKEKVPLIISVMNYQDDKDLVIGQSPIHDIQVSVEINKLFSQHFAVLGSTGSGKSCGVARIFQNLFKKEQFPLNMHLCIFDAYGEYNQAFSNLSNINPNLHFKSYTTNINKSEELIKIPPWLLSVDDLAHLLDVEKNSQLLIIEKALNLVRLFKSHGSDVEAYKNDILARALLDVMLSGKPANQIRDQVFSVLSLYRTDELSLETEIYQPGYNRSLKQCLIIDKDGKILEMELLINFFNTFVIDNIGQVKVDSDVTYSLADLDDAFAFALVSEGVLKSDHVFDEYNAMRVRIHNLATGEYRHYFDVSGYVDRNQYVQSILAPGGVKTQVINFNINYVDDRFAKTIVKIYSKMFFDYSKELKNRGSDPIHIVLEEAHRYVQNDGDAAIIGYNIFDRITKEGRKYGVLLGLISQRPSELSETAISQCANFIIFRTIHYKDIEYVQRLIPNVTEDVARQLKILQPGNCIAFGSAFKVPVIVRLEMPYPTPSSESCDISQNWFHE